MSDDTSDLDGLITKHEGELALAGVLSIRPGFLLRDGVLTGTPAIVVTVAPSASLPIEGLPAEVEGVLVDVRVASSRKALQVQDAVGYARETGSSPDLGAVPHFAAERRVVAPGRTAPLEVPERPLASKAQLPYTTPPGVSLTPVSVTTPITLSASPDSGWPTLEAFLKATTTSLTIGLYDFTSAHVLATFEEAAKGKEVTMVLDHPAKNPTADQTDEQTVADLDGDLGVATSSGATGFAQAWALERMDPKATSWIFPTAYHIKVAVRDSAVVWLSSGNWNNSNQPDIDPVTTPGDAAAARSGDRDWHVVIDDAALAAQFEAYLKHDYEVAAANNTAASASDTAASASNIAASESAEDDAEVPSLVGAEAQTPPFAEFFPSTTVGGTTRVTPLLTPDPGVYVGAVTALVESATTSLHLQFQYIEPPRTATDATAPFTALIAAVIARQKAGVDVKIIMSEYETAGYLEQLQTAGLDVAAAVRLQNNVHNKGMVVDGAKVLVSSQNWSGAGVLQNRDAGVIVESAEAAAYFDKLFTHDWEHLATLPVSAD